MENTLQTISTYVGTVIGGSYALTYLVSAVGHGLYYLFGRKCEDQDELEGVVKKEAKKLGLERKIIISDLTKRPHTARVGLRGFNTATDSIVDYEEHNEDVAPVFILELSRGNTTINNVRHELYHIAKHLGRRPSNKLARIAKTYLYEEPTADLYAFTGARL